MSGSARYRGRARNRRGDTPAEGPAGPIEPIGPLASLVPPGMPAVRNEDFMDISEEEHDSEPDPNQQGKGAEGERDSRVPAAIEKEDSGEQTLRADRGNTAHSEPSLRGEGTPRSSIHSAPSPSFHGDATPRSSIHSPAPSISSQPVLLNRSLLQARYAQL